jgi:hypothetical protein
MAYTTADLIASVQSKAVIPLTQTLFESQDLLDIASEKIEDEILPEILRCRQEFYVFEETLTVVKGAADKCGYVYVPHRSVGLSIIEIKDTDYNEVSKSEYRLQGSRILFQSLGNGESVVVFYYLRPGKLVQTTDVITITGVDTATGVVSCTSVPSTFSTSLKYDFLRCQSGFDPLAISKTASAVGTTSITFTASDLPTGLAVGDYVVVEDTSPVPQIPVDWYSYLSHLVAIQVLETVDQENAALLTKALPKMKSNALSKIAPRIVKKSKSIVSSK